MHSFPVPCLGKCYFWSQEKMLWAAAEQKCRHMGGHLASVTSNDTHDFLHMHVRCCKTYLISIGIIAGEDPCRHLDWGNRPGWRGQLDLDRLQPLGLHQMGSEGGRSTTGQLEIWGRWRWELCSLPREQGIHRRLGWCCLQLEGETVCLLQTDLS